MAFIYVITNQINGKQYVGKTTHDPIEKRWKEHIHDSKRQRREKRPLYNVINKYGAENFTIEQLEECPIDVLENKEIYWINKLNTYHNGYNVTKGGDGKILYDYKEIADKYIELKHQKETANFFKCDVNTVRTACKECGIEILSSKQVNVNKYGKTIGRFDLNNNFIDSFNTVKEAYNVINKVYSSHIQEVCNGKRKQAYGYKWKWL